MKVIVILNQIQVHACEMAELHYNVLRSHAKNAELISPFDETNSSNKLIQPSWFDKFIKWTHTTFLVCLQEGHMGALYFSRSLRCCCIWLWFVVSLSSMLAFWHFLYTPYALCVPFPSTSNIFAYFIYQKKKKKSPFDEINHKHFLIDLN